MATPLKNRDFSPELTFSASRSSGPGGQNVNKVNTRVELRFNIEASGLLNNDEKDLIHKKLKNKINAQGELVVSAQRSRSQLQNKEAAAEKFYKLLEKALTPRKKRAIIYPLKIKFKLNLPLIPYVEGIHRHYIL